MTLSREQRIKPLIWYNLGSYKVYFVQIGKWYAKLFLRHGEPSKTPLFTFAGETKKQVVQQIDDHCMRNFGKVFRFMKVTGQEPIEVKPPRKPKEKVCSNPWTLSKWFEDLNKKMLDTYCKVLYELNQIKKITTLWTMLAAVILAMLIILVTMW